MEDFVQSTAVLSCGQSKAIRPDGGRSTSGASTYFTVDSAAGRLVAAIGWSGGWKCSFDCRQDGLHIAGGLEDCRFFLYPGEKLVLPSMVALFCEEDTEDAYSLFRRLVLRHDVPTLKGRDKSPYIFCNTCFTRGGGWLDECNAENQISLIKALQPLDVEAVITDAGWYPGGWMCNVGNWYPDPARYPDGMAPVAAAAAQEHMRYGLWFELERVASTSKMAKEHPEMLLRNTTLSNSAGAYEDYLVDLGKPEAVDHIYSIVESMLSIPNFGCYRQDFNIDPRPIWRANDTPDRFGVTEIKYINGLYAFLDRIRENHPDVFLNGCAGGGRRMDIEMIKRFHTHQTTDFWFNDTVDQNTQFFLAHYLPNVCFTAHINRYDDYTMNTDIGASLCLGWIADSTEERFGENPPFSFTRARKLIDRYQKARLYLNEDFYPLTEPDNSEAACLASEYIDREKQAGVLLVYKRSQCRLSAIRLCLKKLDPEASYTLTDLTEERSWSMSGAALMEGLDLALPMQREAKVIAFCREGLV